MAETALIVGAGAGLSAALAARNTAKLADLAQQTGARTYACDVARLFDAVAGDMGFPDVVVFNPSARVRGPIAELDPAAVHDALDVTAFGAFLVGQGAARGMAARGSGSILFTGASASIKGFAQSAPFAMGKFALRGLAESMARELQPKNIHVAHFVIYGGILKPDDPRAEARGVDGLLVPAEIARTYLHAHRQHRSAWTFEFALRPWTEKF